MPSNKASSNITESDIQGWGLDDVSGWLKSHKLESCVEEFRSLQIDGQRLLLLTWEEFKTLESLKDEKKKKLLKKGLSNLPGRDGASSKKGKKFGKKTVKGGASNPPPPPQPIGGYPSDDSEVPALPPRPSRPGSNPAPSLPPTRPLPPISSQPPPLPSSNSRPSFPPPNSDVPPPLPNAPRPPSMRPPMTTGGPPVGGYNYQQPEEEESEDIYDAVNPDEDIEESEDIYDDGEDSFDDDEDGVEEEYEESGAFQPQVPTTNTNKDLFALKAKFYAHGIGTLEGRLSYIEQSQQQLDDPIDEEIYDLPPEGTEDWPHPPSGAPPPPPPGAPPTDNEYIDEDIYDLPPEQQDGDGGGDFGYDDNEDIYDIAESDDVPPSQSQPHPPPIQMPSFVRPPMRPMGGQAPPPQGPPPSHNMPRPPLRPPIPTEEDIGGEEIYDCMEEGLEEEEPQNKPSFSGMGMRPPMRAPIESTPSTSRPLLRPPINNQPVNDIQKVKLNSVSNQPPPPRPSSNSKPSGPGTNSFQEMQKAKLSAVANQAPPTRPSSSSKPTSGGTAPPPPPPPPPAVVPPTSSLTSQEEVEEEGSDGGGLASELAKMKSRLRAGSNASPSSTPPTDRKPMSSSIGQSRPPPSPSPSGGGGGGGDLASSIAQARMRLRAGTKSEEPPKEETKPVTPSLPGKINIQKPPPKEIEIPKKTTPPSSPKPFRGPKPQVSKDKPPVSRLKPTPAPKSNKVASLMKSFQQPSEGEQEEGPISPPPVANKGKIELDRSPMTGRRVDRKSSVKELTQRYSLSEEEMSPKHVIDKPSKPPRPSEVPPTTPPFTSQPSSSNNAAMNIFKRKQLEVDNEGPPPSLPGKPSFNKAPPPTPPTETTPFINEGPSSRSPRLPKRDVPRPQEQPPMTAQPQQYESPQKPLPQPIEAPSFPGKPFPKSKDAPPLPGRPFSQSNEAPSLPGRPLSQTSEAPPLPGRPLPQPTEAPPLPGRPLPTQSNEAPPLPGRPLPKQPTDAPSLPGRPLPQPTTSEAPPPLPGRPLPQPTSEAPPPLPGRPLPQPTSEVPPPLPGRPQMSTSPAINKPPVRPPIDGSPSLPARSNPIGSPKGQTWYHASLDRKNAEMKIKRYQKDGTFIIRDNTRTPGEYSLSLWYDGGIRHLRIRKRGDGQFVLGEEKPDEVPFTNVVDLVEFYKTESVVLKSGGQTPLKYECPQ